LHWPVPCQVDTFFLRRVTPWGDSARGFKQERDKSKTTLIAFLPALGDFHVGLFSVRIPKSSWPCATQTLIRSAYPFYSFRVFCRFFLCSPAQPSVTFPDVYPKVLLHCPPDGFLSWPNVRYIFIFFFTSSCWQAASYQRHWTPPFRELLACLHYTVSRCPILFNGTPFVGTFSISRVQH
jgi:hypothetical protein